MTTKEKLEKAHAHDSETRPTAISRNRNTFGGNGNGKIHNRRAYRRGREV